MPSWAGRASAPRGFWRTELVEDLSLKIRNQVLRPGDKLPTESDIMQAYSVSRTVVREALSKLQAAELVETHHGVGTFVLQPRAGGVFRLEPGENVATSVDVLAVLELRISLEDRIGRAGGDPPPRPPRSCSRMRAGRSTTSSATWRWRATRWRRTSGSICRSRMRPATRISRTS